MHVRDLASAMRDRGHDVLVVGGGTGTLSRQLERRGIAFHAIEELHRPIRPAADLVAYRRLRAALRGFGPDLVSTHSTKAGLLGRRAARTLGIPTLFTAHGWGFAPGEDRPYRRLLVTFERRAAVWSRRIITVSEFDRELALENGICEEERIITIRNGVADVGPELMSDPRRSPPRLAMIARFVPQKGHAALLNALARLTHLSWELVLVGDGPGLAEAERLCEKHHIADRSRFLGRRPDVAEIITEAQILALTSHREGLPRSVLEGMRAGLPVIASRVGGVPEAVVDGETGFTVAPSDPETLIRRLESLIRDPSARANMGARAREVYEERFTLERMVRESVAVYAQTS